MTTIHTNAHEHGYMLSAGYFSVNIDNRERFFTVYNVLTDKPVATIIRPRAIDRKGKWEVARTDGTLIARTIGPRNAMRALIGD